MENWNENVKPQTINHELLYTYANTDQRNQTSQIGMT